VPTKVDVKNCRTNTLPHFDRNPSYRSTVNNLRPSIMTFAAVQCNLKYKIWQPFWRILKQNKRKARKSVDTMRNNLDGDVTKSYRMNTQFMFECVLCWLTLGSSRGATSSSFRGGAIFMNFHLMTSPCLLNRGTIFSQTATDKVIFATFPKMRTFQF